MISQAPCLDVHAAVLSARDGAVRGAPPHVQTLAGSIGVAWARSARQGLGLSVRHGATGKAGAQRMHVQIPRRGCCVRTFMTPGQTLIGMRAVMNSLPYTQKHKLRMQSRRWCLQPSQQHTKHNFDITHADCNVIQQGSLLKGAHTFPELQLAWTIAVITVV